MLVHLRLKVGLAILGLVTHSVYAGDWRRFLTDHILLETGYCDIICFGSRSMVLTKFSARPHRLALSIILVILAARYFTELGTLKS